jgi:hypothetical protein
MRVAFLLASSMALSGAGWSELNRAASAAIQAKDYGRLKEVLLQLRPLMPGNARIAYNLACAHSRLGESEAAMGQLKNLASAGVVYDVKADEDFASLATLPGFAAVTAQFEANRQPVTHARLEAKLAEADLIPESIVRAHGFLVSSVRKAKIAAMDGTLFAKTDWPVFALAADPKRKLLWASTGYARQCESCNKTDEGRSALLAFDLVSGAIRERVESPLKGLLSDMTISRTGDLFVSDGIAGAVLRLPAGAKTFERIDRSGEFPSPQTPALSPDQKILYVPDYVRGIAAVDLATHAVAWMTPAPGVMLSGIDGLYLFAARFLPFRTARGRLG